MLLKISQKIFRIIVIVILCILLLANSYVIISRIAFNNETPKIFGYTQVIVISGSMIPTLEIGDILIVHEQKSYGLNDIVTYKGETKLITHRIVEIKGNDYVTKGDFNNTTDDPISPSIVEGKVVGRIHGLGGIVFFLRTSFGILITILGLFLLIKLPSAIKWLKSVRK
jgi:signal peptidase I, archaeal type